MHACFIERPFPFCHDDRRNGITEEVGGREPLRHQTMDAKD
jgi:hypothetical protein